MLHRVPRMTFEQAMQVALRWIRDGRFGPKYRKGRCLVPPEELDDDFDIRRRFMQAAPFAFGPLALTNTYTTDILNPGTTTGGVNSTGAPYDKLKILLRSISIVNKGGADATYRLYRDATGGNTAGKELAYNKSCLANTIDVLQQPGGYLFTSDDFLVGGASAASTLTIHGVGEIAVFN